MLKWFLLTFVVEKGTSRNKPSDLSMERFLEFHNQNDPTKALGLHLGDKSIANGDYVPRSGAYELWSPACHRDSHISILTEAVSAPRISYAANSPAARYIVVCLDFDAPFPRLPMLSPILHWIQSDFQISGSSNTLTTTLPFISNYVGPAPPSGSSPHRYVFFLYEQPTEFNYKDYAPPAGQEMGLWERVRWNLAAWERKAKVENPVAMGYFTSN